MPSNSATTFRARRSGKVSHTPSLEKTRLVSDPSGVDINENRVGSSPLKSILWFLLIVFLAFVAYWALKTYFSSNTDTTAVTPTATPTTSMQESILRTDILPDDPIAPFDDTAFWNTNSQQVASTTKDVEFSIESVVIQPHNSYFSIVYEISGGALTDLPQVTAEMLEDISLSIESISTNNSLLSIGQKVDVGSNVVNSLSRISLEDGVDSYLVGLVSERPFALYSRVDAGKKYIVLDILIPQSKPQNTVVPTPGSSIGPSTTPLPPGAQNLNNEFGRNEQRITTAVSTNIAKIMKYNYFDAPDKFTYRLILGDTIPNAIARLEGTTLTLEVSNLTFDGVVGNGGSGSTDLALTGVTNVSRVDISNSNGVSKYVFTLRGARDFRLFANEDDKSITLEVKN